VDDECSYEIVADCCAQDADCDDGLYCTDDSCDLGWNQCVFQDNGDENCCDEDVDCDDQDDCTEDTCNPDTNLCEYNNIC